MIGSIYRPPTSDTSLLIDSMYAIMEVITRKCHNMKCIWTGDMNIYLFKAFENQLASEFNQLMISYGFLPYIVRPIRVSSHSATILDQIWYNDSSNFPRGVLF